jgi:protein CpxP
MKIRKLASALICLTLLAGTSAVTLAAMPKQDPATAPATQQGMAPKQSQRDRLKAAVDELNLTDDQKAKLGPIFDDAKTKTEAVRGDSTLTAEAKKAKMKEITADLHAKVHAVLTPDQRAQLKEKMQASAPKQPSM